MWHMNDQIYYKDHHYGEFISLDLETVEYLKKGEKYYIVWGQNWDRDYKGEHSIAVIEFDRVCSPKNKKESHYKNLVGKVYSSHWKYKERGLGGCDYSDIYSQGNGFQTGTGGDPVYLVMNWRKGFHPPKLLQPTTLFNY